MSYSKFRGMTEKNALPERGRRPVCQFRRKGAVKMADPPLHTDPCDSRNLFIYNMLQLSHLAENRGTALADF